MNNICLGLVAQSVKNPPAAQGLTSGLGRSSGEGNGNPKGFIGHSDSTNIYQTPAMSLTH